MTVRGAGGHAAADYMHICIVRLSLPESQELLRCSAWTVPPATRSAAPGGWEEKTGLLSGPAGSGGLERQSQSRGRASGSGA